MTDIIMFGLLARLALAPHIQTPAIRLVIAAVAAMLASDVVYSTQVLGDGYDGGLVDVGWLVSYVLFAASILHPSAAEPLLESRSEDVSSRPRVAMLGMAMIIAPILIAGETRLRPSGSSRRGCSASRSCCRFSSSCGCRSRCVSSGDAP